MIVLVEFQKEIFFFLTISISFFTCTCYRYKTFIQYQKKTERKEKPLLKGKRKNNNTIVEWSKTIYPTFINISTYQPMSTGKIAK